MSRAKHWSDVLWTLRVDDYPPCRAAMRWARQQPSPKIAWEQCPYPDWLAWVIEAITGKWPTWTAGAEQRDGSDEVRANCKRPTMAQAKKAGVKP